jgi:hypothetical protein
MTELFDSFSIQGDEIDELIIFKEPLTLAQMEDMFNIKTPHGVPIETRDKGLVFVDPEIFWNNKFSKTVYPVKL